MNTPGSGDPQDLLPLKSLVFKTLLSLVEGDKHGYAIMQEIRRSALAGPSLFPASFYRTLSWMRDHGLIAVRDQGDPKSGHDSRRRYFEITRLGRLTARAEARRLEGLVATARRLELLEPGGTT